LDSSFFSEAVLIILLKFGWTRIIIGAYINSLGEVFGEKVKQRQEFKRN